MNCKPTQAQRQQWNSEENKDVVIFHQTKRTPFSPAISPFAMKLETFLRMHEIKYKSDFDVPGHPSTCKTPWITLNGEDVADSELCIQHIMEKMNVTPKKDLSKPEDKVLYRGLRSVLHDHLYFCIVTERYLYSKTEDVVKFLVSASSTAASPIQFLNKFFIHRTIKMIENQVKAQGVGRMTKEQVYKSAKEDLETLSLALGSQRYFFGDEPSELDCVAFGLLSYALYQPKGWESATEIKDMVQGLENLKAFAERMRDQFWPDWDELCKKAEEDQPKRGKKPPSGGKAEEKKCNGDESEHKKDDVDVEEKEDKANDDKAKQEGKDDKKESD